MPLTLQEENLPSPICYSGTSLSLSALPFPCPPAEEYWLEQLVRDTKWHTSAKLLRVTPAEPHTGRFTAALDKEGARWYFARNSSRRRYEYDMDLNYIRPAPYTCNFEAYLARALQAATAKTAIVIPYKHYTELLTPKLEREGISYEVQAAIEPEAITEQYQRSNFIVYLSTAEPSFTITSSLAELMKKNIIPCRGDRVVRIIPSAQTPLLAEALNEKDIPYHLAHPCSERDSRKEYEVDLTRIVLE